MGAMPRYLLISLAVPRRVQPAQIYRIYQGLMRACGRHGVRLIGGDTSVSESGLFLSITLVGTSSAGRALFRSGARIGDRIYVTGTLGDSLAGLQLLSPGQRRSAVRRVGRRHAFGRALVNRHLRPTARLKEGQWLNQSGLATAAIDLSDGLSGDLRHLCEESHVGAMLDLDRIPISLACRAYAKSRRLNPVQLALTGGEDYELLFAVPATKQRILERQAQRRGYRVTCIGSICAHRYGMRMRVGRGTPEPLPVTSYEHFR
jgi:thiamine-monophosphate kinase